MTLSGPEQLLIQLFDATRFPTARFGHRSDDRCIEGIRPYMVQYLLSGVHLNT